MKEALLDSLETSEVLSSPNAFDEASLSTKRIIVSLLFLSASLSQRKKYELDTSKISRQCNSSDLEACLRFVQILSQSGKQIEHPLITYFASEVMLGGGVHDDRERRLLQCLTRSAIKEEDQPFTLMGQFSPPLSSLHEFKDYICSMPEWDSAAMFGFSESDEQVYQEKKSIHLLRRCTSQLNPVKFSFNEVIKTANHLLTLEPPLIEVKESAGESLFHYILLSEIGNYNRFYERITRVLKSIITSRGDTSSLDHECLQVMRALSLG